MENGKFTKEEREYLLSLDAVEEVRAKSIVYSMIWTPHSSFCVAMYRLINHPRGKRSVRFMRSHQFFRMPLYLCVRMY